MADAKREAGWVVMPRPSDVTAERIAEWEAIRAQTAIDEGQENHPVATHPIVLEGTYAGCWLTDAGASPETIGICADIYIDTFGIFWSRSLEGLSNGVDPWSLAEKVFNLWLRGVARGAG